MAGGKILITGATGFVGRHVTAALLAEGQDLRLLVRDPAKMPAVWQGRLEAATAGDLADAALEAHLAGVETVVHIAGLAGGRFPEASFMRANAVATERLCAAARESAVRRFISISSIMAVADNCAPTIVTDETPPAPHSIYGRSKHAGEMPVAALGREILAVSLRPPLVIGADSTGNWRRLMRLAATGLPLPFGAVRARRSYIAADNLAAAVALVCGSDAAPTLSGAYLVADPQALMLPEVITALRAGMKRPPGLLSIPPGLMAAAGRAIGAGAAVDSLLGPLEADGSRFAERFGFRPALPLIEAIRQSAAAFMAAGAGR